jgi:hypothetical protein
MDSLYLLGVLQVWGLRALLHKQRPCRSSVSTVYMLAYMCTACNLLQLCI